MKLAAAARHDSLGARYSYPLWSKLIMGTTRWGFLSIVFSLGVSTVSVGAAQPALAPAPTGPAVAGVSAPVRSPSSGAVESIEERLLREVGAGAAVAVVPSAQGLSAISSDGARRRTLVPGEVRWVLVDNRGQVIWFKRGEGSELWLLDLKQPTVAAERVAVGVANFEITVFYPGRSGGAAENLETRSSLR